MDTNRAFLHEQSICGTRCQTSVLLGISMLINLRRYATATLLLDVISIKRSNVKKNSKKNTVKFKNNFKKCLNAKYKLITTSSLFTFIFK